MAYRDETERLRARVEELEEQLDTATRRVRALEQPEWEARPRTFGEKLAGGPMRIVREHTIEGELPKVYQEEIIEALHRRFGVFGQASSVGRTLAWNGATTQNQRQLEVSVAVRNGKTVVRVSERLGNLAGGLFGGIVGGLGGGGLGLVLPGLMALRIPQFIPFAIVTWISLVYVIVRGFYARMTARREVEINSAAAELAEIVRDALAREKKKPRVRVKNETAPDEADEPNESEEEETDNTEERPRARKRARR